MSGAGPGDRAGTGGPPPGGAGVVLVADELAAVWGAEPEWPGGHRTRRIAREEPLPRAADVVALVPLLSRPVGATELDRLPALRIVANYAVGYDNVDVRAATVRGVTVTNTPDVLTEATADLAWALLLAAARRLPEGLDLARSGGWSGWAPGQLLGMGLQGRTLGILGAGRIGSAVARRAPAFGLRVLYWSRSRAPGLEREVGAERRRRLEGLLSGSDLVSVHLPLTAETRGLLGPAEIGAMRPGAVLVNTARGEIVDPDAAARALREERLGGLGLDVYPDEPEIPSALREQAGAVLLPHLGSATREARRGMWEVAADNVRRVLSGRPPLTPVRPTANGA